MVIYIWRQLFIPLPYCTFHSFVKADFCTSEGSLLMFQSDYLKSMFGFQLEYAAFSEQSIISYHEQREMHDILVCHPTVDTGEAAVKMWAKHVFLFGHLETYRTVAFCNQTKKSLPFTSLLWPQSSAAHAVQVLLWSTAVSHVQTGHQLVWEDKGFLTADLCSQVHLLKSEM